MHSPGIYFSRDLCLSSKARLVSTLYTAPQKKLQFLETRRVMLGHPKQTIWEGANQGFSNHFFCVLQWDIRQTASIRPCGVVPIILRGNSTEESKFQNRFQNCINFKRFKLSLLLASVYKCLFNQHLTKITTSKVREGERGQASTAVCATPAHSQQVIKESNRTVDLTTSISEMSARHLHTLSIQA